MVGMANAIGEGIGGMNSSGNYGNTGGGKAFIGPYEPSYYAPYSGG